MRDKRIVVSGMRSDLNKRDIGRSEINPYIIEMSISELATSD